ncbi:MAG: hypothetical protein KAG64_01355 [Bacteroidales bacterium]|nr:hypothetical protein [Bacteroidales bacterium]
MSYFKNKSFWFWGFMILLLINISVVGSMSYVMYNIHKHDNYTAFHHKMIKQGKPSYHNRNTMPLVKTLNLNKEQRQEFRLIRKEHIMRVKSLKKQLFTTQHQLFEEAGKNAVDSVLMNEYRTKMMTLQGDIADESIQFLGEMKQQLTPEQQELMKQYFQDKYSKNKNVQ